VAKPLILSPNEKLLFDEISAGVRILRNSNYEKTEEMLKKLAPKARELHMSLKIHGHEPKYHDFILKNREISTDETAFFYHVHPIEDLLAYIKNPEANDELRNMAYGTEFSFPVYIGRQRRYICYNVICTETCWMTDYEDKRVELLNALSSDNVSYPVNAGAMLEVIRKAAVWGTTRFEIQNALSAMAEWISKCEKSKF